MNLFWRGICQTFDAFARCVKAFLQRNTFLIPGRKKCANQKKYFYKLTELSIEIFTGS